MSETTTSIPTSESRRKRVADIITDLWPHRRSHNAAKIIEHVYRGDSAPTIVCLCGSTRFYDEFQRANYALTMKGEIVLSVGFYPHATAEHGHGEGVGHDSAEKLALDELHKRKIDLADYVFVLNVGGYIGESTRGEIEYAERMGVPVRYAEAVR